MTWTHLKAAAAALALGVGAAHAAGSDLVLFEWSGYEDPSFHPAYTEKHGASPTFTFFGDEEEAFQKLRAGFRADIAHPCSQSVVKWREAGLIEPIDPSRIANWGELNPSLRDLPGFLIEGKHYLVPFDWGYTALMVNTEQVTPEQAASLRIFTDPAFAGRISLPENVDDAYALAFLVNGVTDWTTVTDAQFEAASAFLREAVPNVRSFWVDGASLGQLMASGEVVAAWGWNETAFQLGREGHPIALKRETAEGASTWVCGFVDLAGGEASADLVYDYFNAALEDRVARYLVETWAYGHANQAAMQGMDQTLITKMGYDDVAGFKERTLFQRPLPNDLRERMIAEWERIKAGF
jgi:spermidine/putrescine-binding protein